MPFDSESFLKTLTVASGVYQMYNKAGDILYVGKAKNLKNRIHSYFHRSGLTAKTSALVDKIDAIQVTVTETESEALILEQSLIKSQRPPYNILLRDDKSYPYILISSDTYPRIAFHRGAKNKNGQYFGPYPSTGAVYEGLRFLQKTFRVRQCENSVFNNRSRPCLQYQINRCTAPCVNYISIEDYRRDIRHVELFLRGDNDLLLKELADKMDSSSRQLDYEQAAAYRDQIATLRQIQAEHGFEAGQGSIDVLALAKRNSTVCVHGLFIRHGRIMASKSYFSHDKLQRSEEDLLAAFLPQFYLVNDSRELPHEVILSHCLPSGEQDVLQQVLATRTAGKVQLSYKVKSHRKKWLALAVTTAEQN
ncbi:MAG: excinuclease ABC subunit UvrC, partial [Gammaproteobacteria bacterium]|nr:excinuclease ABC subunit UvrC [Gammaproteobacteria bacterium]